MAISEREFSAALAENIPRFTDIGSQDGDKRLVETLTKYTMGLLKEQAAPLSTSDGRAKLSFLLHEFFEDSTLAFVDWLEGFVRINGMPFGVSAPASRMKSTLAAAPPGVSKQEGNTRDVHTARDAGLEARGRVRSRSPATAHRAAPRPPAQGHRAMFEDAVRRTGGHADAGAHPPNIKLEPRSDSPELIVMSPPDGMKVEGVKNAGPGQAGGSRQQELGGERDPGSVVIMNIHFEATPEQVGLFFDEYCKGVVRVTILKNAHGMPKGYAYMELADEETAQTAMKMSGVQFMGRTIKVVPKLKKPPPQALGPPWMLKSLPFMQMMPYVMSAYPPMQRNQKRMQRVVGNHMDAAHMARHFSSPNTRIEFGTSDVWIRGVHDTLGAAVGV